MSFKWITCRYILDNSLPPSLDSFHLLALLMSAATIISNMYFGMTWSIYITKLHPCSIISSLYYYHDQRVIFWYIWHFCDAFDHQLPSAIKKRAWGQNFGAATHLTIPRNGWELVTTPKNWESLRPRPHSVLDPKWISKLNVTSSRKGMIQNWSKQILYLYEFLSPGFTSAGKVRLRALLDPIIPGKRGREAFWRICAKHATKRSFQTVNIWNGVEPVAISSSSAWPPENWNIQIMWLGIT